MGIVRKVPKVWDSQLDPVSAASACTHLYGVFVSKCYLRAVDKRHYGKLFSPCQSIMACKSPTTLVAPKSSSSMMYLLC